MIPTLLIAGFVASFLPRRWATAGIELHAIGWASALLASKLVNGAFQATRATIRMTRDEQAGCQDYIAPSGVSSSPHLYWASHTI